jgi:hypothetical protein
MVRSRLASLAFAASFGLVCGCASLCNHSWFGRHDNTSNCGTEATAGCSTCGSVVSDTVVSEGPIRETTPGVTVPPNVITPQSTVPPATEPRLVPQAAPTPYSPTMRQIR